MAESTGTPSPAPAPAPAPSPTPVPAQSNWFDPLDAETKGYIQNRGLIGKSPVEAFAEAVRFHREAEKFIGAPANEMVRLPKDANAPEWAGVWEKLGKPKEAKDYDFSSVKFANDKPLDQASIDFLRQVAFETNLSKEAAVRLASTIIKAGDRENAAKAAVATDKFNTEKAELKKNWGNNEAVHALVAKDAMKQLGFTAEQTESFFATGRIEGGFAAMAEKLRTIGTKIGEPSTLHLSGGGAGGGPLTVDQAKDELKSLLADQQWKERYLKGGVEETRRMHTLNKLISGVQE
jgi:hypothetical protein